VPIEPPYEPPYVPAGPAYQPGAYQPGANQSPKHRRGGTPMWIPLTLIVLLLGIGGGAFALVQSMGKKQAAQPSGLAASRTVRTAGQPTRPAGTQTALSQPSASVSPSPSVTPSPSPSPSPSPHMVGVAAGVGAVPAQVELVLTHNFQGINDRNYAEYASSRTAQGRASEPESTFDSGYATTTDSGMTLTSLTPTGNGDLIAAVRFTSRQSPSDSVDNSACNNWKLYFYLVPNGAGYLIAPSPPGYDSIYTDC